MNETFELFDHTADVGIRARAGTFAGLLRAAADGLYAVIGDLVPGSETEALVAEYPGSDSALVVRDFLCDLLLAFECHGRMLHELPLVEEGASVHVRGTTRAVDFEASMLHHEVKAITYHELEVRRTPDGWEATVIVDI
jgi:SHS2 domain-containing protein